MIYKDFPIYKGNSGNSYFGLIFINKDISN